MPKQIMLSDDLMAIREVFVASQKAAFDEDTATDITAEDYFNKVIMEFAQIVAADAIADVVEQLRGVIADDIPASPQQQIAFTTIATLADQLANSPIVTEVLAQREAARAAATIDEDLRNLDALEDDA